MKEEGRIAAISGYLTPLGWLVGLIIHLRRPTALGGFHLGQSLLLHIAGVFIFLLQFALLYVPVIGKPAGLLLILAGIVWLFFWAAGLIFAFSGQPQPLPIFGKLAKRMFKRIE